MPSKLPRVNIVCSEDQYSILGELARLQGRSRAAIVREMLDGSTEMLRALLPIYRQAQEAAERQPELLKKAIADALAGIDAQRNQLDMLALIAATPPEGANDGHQEPAAAPSGAREAEGPGGRPGVSKRRAGGKRARG